MTLPKPSKSPLTPDDAAAGAAGGRADRSLGADPGLVVIKPRPLNAESPLAALEAEVTPIASFFVRTNFEVPHIELRAFRLSIAGAVERPLELSLDDLSRLDRRTLTAVLECAGNNRLQVAPLPAGELWQAGAVSAGRWSGVPLRTVLERAGVRPEAVEVLFTGADQGTPKDHGSGVIPFARSLPMAKALHEDTLLALEMNGQPLTPDHGAPLRLLVPGWYGMASVKWLCRIEVLAEPFAGYFQSSRYIYDHADGSVPTPVTSMRVKSVITWPPEGSRLPMAPYVVRGRAWSGESVITRVEVAVDGGEGWREAALGPQESACSWRAWDFGWIPDVPGRHVLRSRATDAAGNVQTAAPQWNRHGYGNNAVAGVVVDIGAERGSHG